MHNEASSRNYREFKTSFGLIRNIWCIVRKNKTQLFEKSQLFASREQLTYSTFFFPVPAIGLTLFHLFFIIIKV